MIYRWFNELGIIFHLFLLTSFVEGVCHRLLTSWFTRFGWALLFKLMFAKTDLGDFVKHAPVLLTLVRIKALQCIHCYVYVPVLSTHLAYANVLFIDHVPTAEVDYTSLSRCKIHFVQQPGNSVHLNQILDVLLFWKSLQGYLVLPILNCAFLNARDLFVTALAAAANAREEPEEGAGPVTHVKFLAQRQMAFILLNSLLRPVLWWLDQGVSLITDFAWVTE